MGKAGYAAFYLLKTGAAVILAGIGLMVGSYERLIAIWNGTKPDTTFSDSVIAQAQKMADEVAKGGGELVTAMLPSELIKARMDSMKAQGEKVKKDIAQDEATPVKAANPGEDAAHKLIETLMAEKEAFGDGTKAKERYKLAQMGVDEATLNHIDQLRQEIDMQKNKAKQEKKWAADAKKVIEDTQNPIEKASAEFDKLKKLYEEGYINEEAFTRGSKQLDAKAAGENKLAGITMSDSKESREAVLLHNNPALKGTDFAEQSVKVQEEIRDILKKKPRKEIEETEDL